MNLYLVTEVVTNIVLLTHILAVLPTTYWSAIKFSFSDVRKHLEIHFTIWEISTIKAVQNITLLPDDIDTSRQRTAKVIIFNIIAIKDAIANRSVANISD